MSTADATEPADPQPRAAGVPRFVAVAMPWVARGAWILVAVIGGSAIESATDGRSDAVTWTAAIGAWVVWALIALSLAVASALSLTVARVGVPLALVAAVVAGLHGVSAADIALLALPSAVAVAAVFSAEFGRRWVQASAYGDELRFPLRPPAAAGAAAIIVWIVWAPALVAGPLLVASRQWVVGVVVTAFALAATVVLVPRWHRLSLRWFVLVPAGVVVHDPVVLAETLALKTSQVAAIRLAQADTGAADLTGPASGYALEVATTESVTAVHAYTPAEPNGKAIHLRAFLVAPSRPGETLRAARSRGLPVS